MSVCPRFSHRISVCTQQFKPLAELKRPGSLLAITQLTMLLLVLLACPVSSEAAAIFVTTTAQKISSTGGCSLQEAIYSADFANSPNFAGLPKNQAIQSYDSFGNPIYITTGCAEGSAGANIIVLPTEAEFVMAGPIQDVRNPFGPTATPLITSNVTIEAHGSTLRLVGQNTRAFAVASTGSLTLHDIYIRDFKVKGGDGATGGGGGLGAGGAIYVKGDGRLTVVRSTFSGNRAIGGNGGIGAGGGGGGGLGGKGGASITRTGGGGGGSLGDGAGSGTATVVVITSGAGGGTVQSGTAILDVAALYISRGGLACGADGVFSEQDGHDATCPGGGGSGGGDSVNDAIGLLAGVGGKGNYGGGGGGGGSGLFGDTADGGIGGFGGGGGAGRQGTDGGCDAGSSGGDGGYGGGGGAGPGGEFSGGSGHGGSFGGNGSCVNGGGGGALGGAIFSDGGRVVIDNSTFTGNLATPGLGAGANSAFPANDGSGVGGAIFAKQGSVTIRNSTISGNQSGNQGGGLYVFVDDLVLYNTILSDNGAPSESDCAVAGINNSVSASGNLITTLSSCPGIWVTVNPQLGPLGANSGITPTLAIAKTSSAFNAADANASLAQDQRGIDRPQAGGFDIGAFELCVAPSPIIPSFCADVVAHPPDDTQPLTMQVSPAAGGTTNPAVGTYSPVANTVAFVSAAPNPGYAFTQWSGGVTDPTSPSTTVVMDGPRTLTANFVRLWATMAGNIVAKSGPSNARVWTLSLLDNGPDAANATSITSFTLTQTFGAACTPVVRTATPIALGNVAPLQTGTANVTIDFTGCAAAARFTAKFNFSANGGFVSGFVTRTNQYQ